MQKETLNGDKKTLQNITALNNTKTSRTLPPPQKK
jgi:hypothetical protein